MSMITVPTVPGRVLQFLGNLLHALPKPVDVWSVSHNDNDDTTTTTNNNNDDDDFNISEDYIVLDDDDYYDDDYNDDWDDDNDNDEQSVILFNMWKVVSEEAGEERSTNSIILGTNNKTNDNGNDKQSSSSSSLSPCSIGPKGVPCNPIFTNAVVPAVPDVIELDEDDKVGIEKSTKEYAKQQQINLLQKWRNLYSNTDNNNNHTIPGIPIMVTTMMMNLH